MTADEHDPEWSYDLFSEVERRWRCHVTMIQLCDLTLDTVATRPNLVSIGASQRVFVWQHGNIQKHHDQETTDHPNLILAALTARAAGLLTHVSRSHADKAMPLVHCYPLQLKVAPYRRRMAAAALGLRQLQLQTSTGTSAQLVASAHPQPWLANVRLPPQSRPQSHHDAAEP